MKPFGKVRIERWFLTIAMLAMGALVGGCLKDDNQVYQVAAVRALNAIPGSGQLDVFLGQNKLNFDNEIWQDEEFAYSDTLPYKNAWPNNRVVSIVNPMDYPNAKPIVQKTVNFIPGKFYSLYVVGYDDIEVLATEDDLTHPTEGKAKVRFVHLSPNAPTLDFEVYTGSDGNTLRIDDKAFKETTGFAAVEGDITYTINFIEHDGEALLHTFEFVPEAGMIYTVWVSGLIDNAGDATLAFGHGIISH
ncbi:MAG TPA: DUF4397 domain-containing protein [Parapedobacter sp.]|uniref:DUF4397 domain-containing protein n=1 Tax=Parapedobacter sp. TaxID=1958893 RepID=UPI002CE8D463|nr:DUF4397 domain-containing protein [Parapedobacter sp.]HWK56605.1 DUF4397 domain-containing protein [Parapedobacter sp.]